MQGNIDVDKAIDIPKSFNTHQEVNARLPNADQQASKVPATTNDQHAKNDQQATNDNKTSNDQKEISNDIKQQNSINKQDEYVENKTKVAAQSLSTVHAKPAAIHAQLLKPPVTKQADSPSNTVIIATANHNVHKSAAHIAKKSSKPIRPSRYPDKAAFQKSKIILPPAFHSYRPHSQRSSAQYKPVAQTRYQEPRPTGAPSAHYKAGATPANYSREPLSRKINSAVLPSTPARAAVQNQHNAPANVSTHSGVEVSKQHTVHAIPTAHSDVLIQKQHTVHAIPTAHSGVVMPKQHTVHAIPTAHSIAVMPKQHTVSVIPHPQPALPKLFNPKAKPIMPSSAANIVLPVQVVLPTTAVDKDDLDFDSLLIEINNSRISTLGLPEDDGDEEIENSVGTSELKISQKRG